MELGGLRELLRPHIGALKDRGTADQLPDVCSLLGLPPLGPEGSKRERMLLSFDTLPDSELAETARRFLAHFPPAPQLRNRIQDFLWAEDPGPTIAKRFRREIARALSAEDLYSDASRFDDLLTSLWIIDDNRLMSFFGGTEHSLRYEITRNVFDNPGDWTPEYLFDRLGAFDCSDRRFRLFLEGLVSSDVHPEEAEQRRIAALINTPLLGCDAELRETGTEGGYPTFTVISLRHGIARRPKNLIFASAVKPDIRIRDAVSNDIEIVTNADKVLVYDQPIGSDGLRWRDLQEWWSTKQGGLNEAEAKRTLYLRLRESLPSSSPPQRFFFETFYKAFGPAVHSLPALVPEVWLHWDPKTVRERGAEALTRFRMDFLMLLPRDIRTVIEVDGRQHFAERDGRASPMRYAAMVAADRELRLAGYEVFRFGAAELDGGTDACTRVQEFFQLMFKRYRVTST